MTVLVIPLNEDQQLTGEAMDDVQIFPTQAQARRYIDRKIIPKYGHNFAILDRETNFSYARR